MLNHDGLIPLCGGALLLALLYLGKRRAAVPSPSTGVDYVLFGLTPITLGLVRLVSPDWWTPMLLASAVTLLSAVPLGLVALVRRRKGGCGAAGLLGLLALFVLVFGVAFSGLENYEPELTEEQRQTARPCTAVVADVRQTNVRINNRHVFELQLRVRVDGHPEFNHRLQRKLDMVAVARVVAGNNRFHCQASQDLKTIELDLARPQGQP